MGLLVDGKWQDSGYDTKASDGEFVRAALEGRQATPDLFTAVRAHRIVDAIYASAAAGGMPVEP